MTSLVSVLLLLLLRPCVSQSANTFTAPTGLNFSAGDILTMLVTPPEPGGVLSTLAAPLLFVVFHPYVTSNVTPADAIPVVNVENGTVAPIPWSYTYTFLNGSATVSAAYTTPTLPGLGLQHGMLTRSTDAAYVLAPMYEQPPGTPTDDPSSLERNRAVGAVFYDRSIWWYLFSRLNCAQYTCDASDAPTFFGVLGDEFYNSWVAFLDAGGAPLLFSVPNNGQNQAAARVDVRGVSVTPGGDLAISTRYNAFTFNDDYVVIVQGLPLSSELYYVPRERVTHAFSNTMEYGGLEVWANPARNGNVELWVASAAFGVLRFVYDAPLSPSSASLRAKYELWTPGCALNGEAGTGEGPTGGPVSLPPSACAAAPAGVLDIAVGDALPYAPATPGACEGRVARALYVVTRTGLFAIDLPSAAPGDSSGGYSGAPVWRNGGAAIATPLGPPGSEFRGISAVPITPTPTPASRCSPSPEPPVGSAAPSATALPVGVSPFPSPSSSASATAPPLANSPAPSLSGSASASASPSATATGTNATATAPFTSSAPFALQLLLGPLASPAALQLAPALLLRLVLAQTSGWAVGAIANVALETARNVTISARARTALLPPPGAAGAAACAATVAPVAFGDGAYSAAPAGPAANLSAPGADPSRAFRGAPDVDVRALLTSLPKAGAYRITPAAVMLPPTPFSLTATLLTVTVGAPPSNAGVLAPFYEALGYNVSVTSPDASDNAYVVSAAASVDGSGITPRAYAQALQLWGEDLAAQWVAGKPEVAGPMQTVFIAIGAAPAPLDQPAVVVQTGWWWSACAGGGWTGAVPPAPPSPTPTPAAASATATPSAAPSSAADAGGGGGAAASTGAIVGGVLGGAVVLALTGVALACACCPGACACAACVRRGAKRGVGAGGGASAPPRSVQGTWRPGGGGGSGGANPVARRDPGSRRPSGLLSVISRALANNSGSSSGGPSLNPDAAEDPPVAYAPAPEAAGGEDPSNNAAPLSTSTSWSLLAWTGLGGGSGNTSSGRAVARAPVPAGAAPMSPPGHRSSIAALAFARGGALSPSPAITHSGSLAAAAQRRKRRTASSTLLHQLGAESDATRDIYSSDSDSSSGGERGRQLLVGSVASAMASFVPTTVRQEAAVEHRAAPAGGAGAAFDASMRSATLLAVLAVEGGESRREAPRPPPVPHSGGESL